MMNYQFDTPNLLITESLPLLLNDSLTRENANEILGRLQQSWQPHYTKQQIDIACELIHVFLDKKHDWPTEESTDFKTTLNHLKQHPETELPLLELAYLLLQINGSLSDEETKESLHEQILNRAINKPEQPQLIKIKAKVKPKLKTKAKTNRIRTINLTHYKWMNAGSILATVFLAVVIYIPYYTHLKIALDLSKLQWESAASVALNNDPNKPGNTDE